MPARPRRAPRLSWPVVVPAPSRATPSRHARRRTGHSKKAPEVIGSLDATRWTARRAGAADRRALGRDRSTPRIHQGGLRCSHPQTRLSHHPSGNPCRTQATSRERPRWTCHRTGRTLHEYAYLLGFACSTPVASPRREVRCVKRSLFENAENCAIGALRSFMIAGMKRLPMGSSSLTFGADGTAYMRPSAILYVFGAALRKL